MTGSVAGSGNTVEDAGQHDRGQLKARRTPRLAVYWLALR
jgi:hypothetical protein